MEFVKVIALQLVTTIDPHATIELAVETQIDGTHMQAIAVLEQIVLEQVVAGTKCDPKRLVRAIGKLTGQGAKRLPRRVPQIADKRHR